MILYGTSALAICMLIGMLIGDLLGLAVGVEANVGGVGFAMLLLIFVVSWLRKKELLPKPTEQGLLFWSGMYIPIVVAMASTQNMVDAVSGGPMALLAGILAIVAGGALVPLIGRIGERSEPLPPMTEEELQEN